MIALLRSMDMPLADVRRVLRGVTDDERQELFVEHRRRLEDRLQEVRELLEVVDAMVSDDSTTADVTSDPNGWLHAMPRLPVTDLDRSIEYYEEALGLRLAWRTADGSVAAMASGPVEYLLLVPWVGDGPPPPQASYVYVEDPDVLCAEFVAAGAEVVEPVASRPNGMRDFAVRDPDGRRLTLGRGEDRLRDLAEFYGMERDQIAVDPVWLRSSTRSGCP